MVTVCPSQFATRRTLFHVLVGCGLLMLKVSRLKLPVIWLLVSMWLNTLTKSQIWTLLLDRKSGSAGMPRPISYAVFCLKKKNVYQESIAFCGWVGDFWNEMTAKAAAHDQID